MRVKLVRNNKTVMEVRIEKSDPVLALVGMKYKNMQIFHDQIKKYESKKMDVGAGSLRALFFQRQINICNNLIKIYTGEGTVIHTHD